MKLLLASMLLVVYLFLAPQYFVDLTSRLCHLDEFTLNILEYVSMLSGAIVFAVLVPPEWLGKSRA